MKKFYENPELVVIKLAKVDVITTSPDADDGLWQPGEPDIDWDGYLNVNN